MYLTSLFRIYPILNDVVLEVLFRSFSVTLGQYFGKVQNPILKFFVVFFINMAV
jgi:hypothetical protein